jgi:dTDP-4-amino-4,6-dideoxygalactose transaminase
VIEDNAQAIGLIASSLMVQKKAGTIGHVGATSFSF